MVIGLTTPKLADTVKAWIADKEAQANNVSYSTWVWRKGEGKR